MPQEAATLHARSDAAAPRGPGGAGAAHRSTTAPTSSARIFRACTGGLKAFLKTSDEVLMLACSGTGAMEAAVVNVLSPGDTMLALVAGNFGERWAAARPRARHGRPRPSRRPGARPCPPRPWPRRSTRIRAIRGVFVQLSESSTGAAHDVEALAQHHARASRTRCSWWTRSRAPAPCRSRPRPGASTSWSWAARRPWPCRRASRSSP